MSTEQNDDQREKPAANEMVKCFICAGYIRRDRLKKHAKRHGWRFDAYLKRLADLQTMDETGLGPSIPTKPDIKPAPSL